MLNARRAPYGARGLKFGVLHAEIRGVVSRPVRGAWIEMAISWRSARGIIVAPRKGRVD